MNQQNELFKPTPREQARIDTLKLLAKWATEGKISWAKYQSAKRQLVEGLK